MMKGMGFDYFIFSDHFIQFRLYISHIFMGNQKLEALGMGSCLTSDRIQCRGRIDLVYSSTSGTSKKVASQLQSLLQAQKYLANITNIGDYDHQSLLDSQGTVIFLLSTYGDGESPEDGEKFHDWIMKFDPKQRLQKLQYSIIAFGNSAFQNHCGFGLKTQKFMKKGGAKQLLQITMCDAGSKEKDSSAKFPSWSKKLIELLNSRHQLKETSKSDLGSSYQATLSNIPEFNWEEEAKKSKNLQKQFQNFFKMYKAKVSFIRQLRNDKDLQRSTLHIRIKIDPSVKLWPACNVEIFPLNTIYPVQKDDNKIISFSQVRGKVPFAQMPLGQLKKLLDFRQKANDKQVKSGFLLSQGATQKVAEYQKRVSEKNLEATCSQLYTDLHPKFQFLPEIGLNNVRTYTLSSWQKDQKYLDLCIALVKNGLTSSYIKSRPQFVRIRTIPSTFYIPEGKRPICMIANGSGIAPFRSIAQYVQLLPPEERPYLRLYYGIQNQDVDYYFGKEWKDLEQNKIVDVKLAESRRDPTKKEYVQNVLQKDLEWLTEHIFTNNGVVFICGGTGMSKDINNIIFKAAVNNVKLPYKAFTLISVLKQQKTIVEQIFG